MLDIIIDQMQKCTQNYSQNLPTNIPEAIGKSAIYSFAFATLLSGDLHRGRVIGMIAMVASAVDALTLPIFRQLFGNQVGDIAWYHHVAAIIVNCALTQGVINTLTSYRVDLVAASVMMVAWSLVARGGLYDHQTHYARPYVFC